MPLEMQYVLILGDYGPNLVFYLRNEMGEKKKENKNHTTKFPTLKSEKGH